MTWTDGLRRVTLSDGRRLIGASFRGVPFFVESTDRQGGRRIVVHEFPQRDDPFVDDLGRKARTFHVEGYVLGEDYLTQRDALLSALEDTAGPGELVHPSHGVRRAVCSSLTTREALSTDGRMARLSIEFTEAPAQTVVPTIVPDLPGKVSASSDVALVAAEADLATGYDPARLPAFALASAETAVRSLATKLGAALAPVVTSTQELAALTGKVNVITAEASSLVRQPADILGAFVDALGSLAQTTVNAPLGVLNALLEAYDVDMGPAAPETTVIRQRERANQIALTAALQQLMVLEAARLAPLAGYPSIEDANATRDEVASRLDEQAGIAGDAAYPALITLRADVLRAVPGDRMFARIITIERRVAIPSLLLAHQLYGSVDKDQDLIDRNHIRHPGFVSGTLRALTGV